MYMYLYPLHSPSSSPPLKGSSALPAEPLLATKTSSPEDQGPMYQDPGTITHTPHPETGEIYTEVKPDKKKKKKEQKTSEESGHVYQVWLP